MKWRNCEEAGLVKLISTLVWAYKVWNVYSIHKKRYQESRESEGEQVRTWDSFNNHEYLDATSYPTTEDLPRWDYQQRRDHLLVNSCTQCHREVKAVGLLKRGMYTPYDNF